MLRFVWTMSNFLLCTELKWAVWEFSKVLKIIIRYFSFGVRPNCLKFFLNCISNYTNGVRILETILNSTSWWCDLVDFCNLWVFFEHTYCGTSLFVESNSTARVENNNNNNHLRTSTAIIFISNAPYIHLYFYVYIVQNNKLSVNIY